MIEDIKHCEDNIFFKMIFVPFDIIIIFLCTLMVSKNINTATVSVGLAHNVSETSVDGLLSKSSLKFYWNASSLPQVSTPLLNTSINDVGKKINSVNSTIINATSNPSYYCSNCEINKIIETINGNYYNGMNLTEIHKLKTDEIKRQILKKLRLEDRPNATTIARSMLPAPLQDGELNYLFDSFNRQDRKDDDDYYGKTERVIIVAETGNVTDF